VHPSEALTQQPAILVPGSAEGLAPVARIVAAIPAPWASTRLPGKPLALLAGRPMVEHVYRRVAAAAGIGRVVVLTDDERVGQAVEAFGGEWEMTPSSCTSGTDRIAFAAAMLLYILAKAAEVLDHEIAAALGFVTGHTLKHLIATAATAAVVWGLTQRFSGGGDVTRRVNQTTSAP